VLILGESGTGKELLARAIHLAGSRSDGPFIPVNCSAIPGELAESLLFGHVKGAFTGATADRRGCFELAHGGTLFLDEVSELPLPLQPKLLRVLEDGEVVPVGAARGRTVRAHIVAASNADFTERIAQGRFRQDLYFRLARFTVEVPPLRDRREDVPLLAHHFIRLFAQEMNLPHPRVTEAAMRALTHYDFPGNVRELKNILERALMECEGGELREEHLHFFGAAHRPPSAPSDRENPPPTLANAPTTDEDRILHYLRAHGAITNAESRSVLRTDRNHACYVLRKLTEEGALVCEGHGRWARYRLP
jgi:transcriptional regulator with GAF, ATPase, and Fis domain